MLTATIRALLEDVLDPLERGLDAGCLHGAVQDMEGRIRGMPRYMGVGIAAVTVLVGLSGYPRWSRARRLSALDRLRSGPVGPLRDFVEFYEKMGTFTYFSRVEHRVTPPGSPR